LKKWIFVNNGLQKAQNPLSNLTPERGEAVIRFAPDFITRVAK
jgi:hypothetical protein